MLSRNNSAFKALALIVMMFWSTIAVPNIAFSAGDAKEGGEIGKALCNVVDLLTGKAGKAIATIAIIFLAFGLFVGKVSWGVAVATGIGISAIFGAETIITMITGVDGVGCKS
ncbi:TrbC/VirB2 family type IV secretion system protein [Rickettsiales endosymbiont of Stachyamoeba lipophora]|uniref:TrbC/VirB2 family protein n=1 Tax=Rickettsiales endosymbiont of Stachyamoeba lipophora TaxID=2486578 RepID=UPI000F645EEB|nr:TrbC/VirB2 family protein [Rickettsiales endosymbiont of Stachyamoeba lipophora]AZL16144.1 hypothetical protein EF513_06320 [Rickettsiales endosymbiont of Stachyamoeba lipophora]